MKRFFLAAALVLCGLVLGFGLCFLIRYPHSVPAPAVTKAAVPSAAVQQEAVPPACESEALIDLAYTAAAAIRDQDFPALSRMVHPEQGLLFSPYAYVNSDSARRFTAEQVAAFSGDNSSYVWGVYDGSGEPIELSIQDYFQRFVFDRDFTAAPVVGIDRILYSGNTLENVTEVFPGAHFVELYDPGTEPDGLDWAILRLVFTELDGEYYLTAVSTSAWGR